MKKKRFLLILMVALIALSHQCFAGDKDKVKGKGRLAYSGFSGGMSLHTGYVFGGNVTLQGSDGTLLPRQKVQGMPTGIGGAGRFHFGRHMRIGAEGYRTSLNYGKYGSNLSIGWGGILVDCLWRTTKVSPFAGFTIGGGSVKNTTLNSKVKKDFIAEENASYRKYSFMAIVPFVGLEYATGKRLSILFKVDWMFDISSRQPDFPGGPRFYIGLAFYRPKVN